MRTSTSENPYGNIIKEGTLLLWLRNQVHL